MKIKKFEARTEQAAIEMVRDEFGPEALVLNIKTTRPRGLFRLFRKSVVEVTAAQDDAKKPEKAEAPPPPPPPPPKTDVVRQMEAALRDVTIAEQRDQIEQLERLLVSQEEMLSTAQKKLSVAGYSQPPERRFQNNIVQMFYDQLVCQGVKPGIAADLLSEVANAAGGDALDVALVVNIIYDKIVRIVGEPVALEAREGNDVTIAAFIGPTGVGKTTTIAKLSAEFILQRGSRVGLITADTYRIAAVEQLKTYADILGLDVGVVYTKRDMLDYVELMRLPEDIILIDTAGRSHRNTQNMAELRELIDELDACDMYLVLSLTTKYEDMLDIVNTYARFFDFRIIFTKLDETLSLGAALNLCYDTKKRISYVTFGQNVPEDIRPLTGEDVARAVLGADGPAEGGRGAWQK